MKIVLLGPPLSGKGTQGQFLAERFHLNRLSVGALIRKLYREKTPEGLAAGKYMVKGEAIPGDLLMSIIVPWLKNHKNGFVLDNLVRSHEQLAAFKKYSKLYNFTPDAVININISESEIQSRLAKRIEDHKNRKIYRPDETIDKLKTRLKVYKASIKEILDYFRETSVLIEIEGEDSVLKVHHDIIKKLNLNDLTDDY